MSISLLTAERVPQHRGAWPRLLLLSHPSSEVLTRMALAVAQLGLQARLGRAMFDACNWHQSWSGRYEDTPAMRARLRRVGDRISATAFTLQFNRVRGHDHWELRCRGRPDGFEATLGAVRAELLRSDLEAPGHTPHITISYRAPEPLKAVSIAPIEWPLNEILLVVGHGHPYRYEVIDRWKLSPAPPSRQLPLF